VAASIGLSQGVRRLSSPKLWESQVVEKINFQCKSNNPMPNAPIQIMISSTSD
jgi:hypothetical protein